MLRACSKCGRVVPEAAYCPFCSEPTIEHIPAYENRTYTKTFYTQFARRKRWITVFGVGVISFLMFFAGCFFRNPLIVHPAYLFCVSFAGALFFYVVSSVIAIVSGRVYPFPCRRCEKRIDVMAIGQDVHYCPFCGLDLEVEIGPESAEPTELLKKGWGQRDLNIKNTAIQVLPGVEEERDSL